jgi:DNA polymerase-3 subunit delta'
MSAAQFFPWQVDVAQQWLSQRERFAHAWLVHGLAGIGKREFAFAAAAALMCESPVNGLACGQCLACGWVAKGNHPDLKRIRPETVALEEGAEQDEDDSSDSAPVTEVTGSSKRAPSKDIRVEQIRSLAPWFNNATHRSGFRVALVYPAEALTQISGNTLLKVLEEPPPATIFLLIADAPDRLLPTLLSRCRRLPLATPSPEVAHAWLGEQNIGNAAAWLAASGGAPVLAKKMAETQPQPCPEWLSAFAMSLEKGVGLNVGQLADSISKEPANLWIELLQRLVIDMNLKAHGLEVRYFPALQKSLGVLCARLEAVQLSELADWLNQQRRVAGHTLNGKLFAHSVLQRIAATCQPSNAAGR